MQDRRRVAAWVLVLAMSGVLSGCSAEPATPVTQVVTAAPSAPPTPTPVTPVLGCPDLVPRDDGAPAGAAIDYVDFVKHDGRHYLAGFTDVAPITRADLGEVALRSACSFSDLNERTHEDPGPPRDADTGFLPTGTEIRAVHGWPPECRLAAERNGRIVVYLAQDPTANQSRTAACARDRTASGR